MSTPKDDKAAIRAIIRAVRAAGWHLDHVNDGEEEIAVATEEAALDAITAVDEARLYVRKQGRRGWVLFVMGNEPYEVAADYTVGLTDAIDPLTDSWDD